MNEILCGGVIRKLSVFYVKISQRGRLKGQVCSKVDVLDLSRKPLNYMGNGVQRSATVKVTVKRFPVMFVKQSIQVHR